MPDTTHTPTWTSFETATKEDFLALDVYEEEFNAGLVDRLMDAIRALDVPAPAYPVNRYEHSLQTATRAYEDGADEEIVVAALLHDVGDTLSPYNHSQLAAAILKPYVSERTWWIIARRLAAGLITKRRYISFLVNRAFRERIFLLTLPRLMLAYRTGAMRYGLIWLERPSGRG